jgi:hypothetical protein
MWHLSTTRDGKHQHESEDDYFCPKCISHHKWSLLKGSDLECTRCGCIYTVFQRLPNNCDAKEGGETA